MMVLPPGVAGVAYPPTALGAADGLPPYAWTVLAGGTGLPSGNWP